MEWISVKDRLPENKSNVLFFTNGFTKNVMRMGNFYLEDSFGRKNQFCDGAFFPIEFISHWMPLPEPPKTINP